MNNRQILIIIIAATLLLAIAIIIIFIALAKREKGAVPPGYSQYIEDLKTQGAPPGGASGNNQADELLTYSGSLVAVESGLEGNTLTLKDSQSGNTVRFSLRADTTIVYGTKQLQLNDLHAGDELRVTAAREPDGALVAKTITVVVSTSPTVPTQINVPPATPGVILPPSKRNIL